MPLTKSGFVPKLKCPTCGFEMEVSKFIDGTWTGQWLCKTPDCIIGFLEMHEK